ncbi:hypothetical protein V9L05_01665 [Bernardetia sp. Wsw4-3y2]|uniref:hypothetical protein n=1 Tax=Bernardetia sp. Wsw4-3y2 TaxID=3127471 RepID=UPI0030D4D2B9
MAYQNQNFKDEVITHSAMILGYAEKFEQARWVTHIITPDIVKASFGRSNDFREDDKVSTGSSKQEDYFLIAYFFYISVKIMLYRSN